MSESHTPVKDYVQHHGKELSSRTINTIVEIIQASQILQAVLETSPDAAISVAAEIVTESNHTRATEMNTAALYDVTQGEPKDGGQSRRRKN